jgi:uncharacterized protein YuzE
LKKSEDVPLLAKSENLAIDVPKIVTQFAAQYNLNLPSKIVMFHYDYSADTLYVHFEYLAKNVDSRIVDKCGEIVLGFNGKGKVVNPTMISASTYIPQNK